MSKVHSESEDEPYVSSGSEWDSAEEKEQGRKGSRRSSARISKKPRLKSDSSSNASDDDDDEDDEEESEEERKPRKRNGVNKKRKVSRESSPESETIGSRNKDFSTGSFLILKKDAKLEDPEKQPCIWRVDGKALLQKYEPFEDGGKTRHKTTSVYTGWSAMDRDLYAPVTVTIKQHVNNSLIVDLNWDKLKDISQDSE